MRHLFFLLSCSLFFTVKGQDPDSVHYRFPDVELTSFSPATSLRLLASEGIIGRQQLSRQPSYSLLPAINTVPGVRMEERSPGSYRLSIRGSLLRSPFGVRNVKIYLGDFPFTDAGGNTYLNGLDISHINSIRIIKGPEASIFGANTGGVLLIDPVQKTSDSLALYASVSGGSFGLFHENVLFQKKTGKAVFTLNQSYLTSDGYRRNSALQRHFIQGAQTWYYHPKAVLKALVLFSDLQYQTPGGLTLVQFKENPRMARPATLTLPGATEQKAGINNRTVFAGISHDISLGKNLRHMFALFGSTTAFTNPFITNYEKREEASLGARSFFELRLFNKSGITGSLNLGGEWQQSNATIFNYGNKAGSPDTLQAADRLIARQSFVYTRFLVDIKKRLLAEVSVSYNLFAYQYRNMDSANYIPRSFNPQWMPRIAFSYLLTHSFSIRASASGGYSAPTIAEVRASDNRVNTSLQAETCRSYEGGVRLNAPKGRWSLDASVFYYALQNAIVRRLDTNGTEYFINAGTTRQPGLELQAEIWLVKPRSSSFIRSAQLHTNLTHNRFTFGNYMTNAGNDYSGKKLTGVPAYTSASSLDIEIIGNISFYLQYYYCSELPLDDANSNFAEKYHLLQLRAEWKTFLKQTRIGVFAGADNLLNQTYSLGNDLNASGGRYYNAAAPVNCYAGLRAGF